MEFQTHPALWHLYLFFHSVNPSQYKIGKSYSTQSRSSNTEFYPSTPNPIPLAYHLAASNADTTQPLTRTRLYIIPNHVASEELNKLTRTVKADGIGNLTFYTSLELKF